MNTWVIITCSLINDLQPGRDYETRKAEYMTCIPNIMRLFKDCNIIIVENHSSIKPKNIIKHMTFLDRYGTVVYTKTNQIVTRNYGMKELLDIQYCISNFNIPDDDFIVKITGRYNPTDNSEFLRQVKIIQWTKYDAIVRYGSFEEPACSKKPSCITGLIGLRCKYVKELEIPDEDTYVEDKWARKIMSLDDSKVCVLEHLGIFIRPCGSQVYFFV